MTETEYQFSKSITACVPNQAGCALCSRSLNHLIVVFSCVIVVWCIYKRCGLVCYSSSIHFSSKKAYSMSTQYLSAALSSCDIRPDFTNRSHTTHSVNFFNVSFGSGKYFSIDLRILLLYSSFIVRLYVFTMSSIAWSIQSSNGTSSTLFGSFSTFPLLSENWYLLFM